MHSKTGATEAGASEKVRGSMLQISKKRIREIADDGWVWVEGLKGNRRFQAHSEEARKLAKELLKLISKAAVALEK